MSNTSLPDPYGRITTHTITGQQFFYRWPESPYLDNAKECIEVVTYSDMRQYAAAVSAADNAALRVELAKHQESEFHPDWSLLEATRDSLAEHQEIIRDQRERIKVLEDALQHVNGCLSINDYGDYVLLSLFDAEIVRTALGDKNG